MVMKIHKKYQKQIVCVGQRLMYAIKKKIPYYASFFKAIKCLEIFIKNSTF